MTVRRLQVDLTDASDPTFSSPPSGDLLDTTRPLTGVRTVSFSASDQGSGVYPARLEVDGAGRRVRRRVDDNGGRCVKPFKDLVPCRQTASGIAVVRHGDAARRPHSVRLVVTDATETNTVAYGPVQVTTGNQAATCAADVSRRPSPRGS